MKRLVLIDGKSVFYRGYYAMGALSTSDGTPTGGIYGFAAIAMEIVKKLEPTKVVVAWDSRTSTARRRAIFADYKAGRTKPGDDFYAQIPLLKELVLALGWEFVEIDEYEADDIIGTLAAEADVLAEQALAAGKPDEAWDTFIVSSDLDMLQIVDANTRMYRILKGFTSLEEIDVVAFEQKYGIKQAQFLDLKALKGDASDNIPGVPGIGEKTAVKLLNEFGDLDGIYANLDKIAGATGKKLADGRESAFMSRELAKMMLDAPVKLADLADFRWEQDKVVAALRKLEFRSLIRKFFPTTMPAGDQSLASGQRAPLPHSGDASPTPAVAGSARLFSVVTSEDPLGGSVRSPAERKSVVSPAGNRSSSSSGCAELTSEHEVREPRDDERERHVPEEDGGMFDGSVVSWSIKQLMHENPEIAEKILAGAKFWDLGQGAFLLNPLARDIEQGDVAAEYARQKYEFSESPQLKRVFEEFDLPLIPVLFAMEKSGMLIDREYFAQLKSEFETEVAALEQKVWDYAGRQFNVNSPVQLAEVLYGDLGLSTKGIKKTARGYSTGVKELDKLENSHPIIKAIKEYRENAKLLSTYIIPLPELADKHNRIHTTFNQNVTATGRLSSTNPNLQNIPVRTEVGKRIREGFIAPAGKVIVSADYSQFELRLAAVLAQDAALMEDFNHEQDIHTKTASEAFSVPVEAVSKAQRRAAKVINFGVLYGMSAKGLADAAGMSVPEAKEFIEKYFELRKPIKEYLDGILKHAREKGYVETYFGRRRPTPDVLSSNFMVRTGAERAAQNMPIQGTEADLMKRAMLKVSKALPTGAKLIMQVHDSLMVECDETEAEAVSAILRREMENVAPELPIKLKVDAATGKNWGEV